MVEAILPSARSCLARLAALGVSVERLTNDSRRVQPGDVFVAYPGERRDGREFIDQAVSAGAAAVLWEAEGYAWPEERKVPNLGVHGLRSLAGKIAHELAGEPSAALWMIGVTGTNGKTSCSQWIASALTGLGRPTAVIGTLGHGFPGALIGMGNTTPDAIALHPMLAHYRRLGARCVAMEVSSHGLAQDRLSGAHFDVALFTNLTRDHLDYHGDMQSYGEAKARLFEWPGLGCAVINVDDAFGRSLVGRLAAGNVDVLTYGLSGGAISGHRLDLHRLGLDLEIQTPWGAGKLRSPLLGAYNAVNLLGVLGVLLAAEVPFDDALSALAGLTAAEGRMQTLGGGDRPVIVIDYAHTPDALEQVLTALRAHLGAGRLVCLFGCGGDRDAGKRPAMGEIASRLADAVIVTSDNPRNEDPDRIIVDIVAGARRPVEVEPDRRGAIAGAIRAAHAGDVILIAGKGHERWQEIGAERYPFNDAEIAAQCLDGWIPAGSAPDARSARA
ncbi:MAG: UDP-N-acetylmuramoyl-L-alanyl-D-glutamate--2,6-diaminopimelate ligase [Betaproteobacteria bacterium]|nr:MAG: UDP-N-acetylmuramoyl-L-alanyl-D-glutamate--2,6-diaminopimelate ligase [Betaproteobacteria bacterium]